jgi:hypothetical protein
MFYEVQKVITASRQLPPDTPKNEIVAVMVMSDGLMEVASDIPGDLFSCIGPVDPCCLTERTCLVRRGNLTGYPSLDLIPA